MLLQVAINWNVEQIVFVPEDWTVRCLVDATSPSPSVVENVIVHSFQFLIFNQFRLTASWDQPVVVNGPQDDLVYSLCLTREPVVLITDDCTGDSEALITALTNITVSTACTNT